MINNGVVDYVGAGKRIKIARIKRDMSQEMLASKADMSIQYLSHVENARSKASLSTFVKIANALDLSLDELMCDSLIRSRIQFEQLIAETLSDCSDDEIRFLAKALDGIKLALRDNEAFIQKRSMLE